MPYIPKDRRSKVPETVGELNYFITKIVNDYLVSHGLSYTSLNGVIGVLECAKLELYRRVAVGYEEKKCKENGDVYSQELLGEQKR